MTLTKTAIIRQKMTKFDEHSWPSEFVWKNLDSTKARPAYCKHFCTEMGRAVSKNRAGNQGCNNHASKTQNTK
jgi:hypothetical protein